jgi:anaerobic selenocysteine-containing dehydrogenase
VTDAGRREVLSFCRICAANCGITVDVDRGEDGDQVVRVRGDAGHPVSRGYTCAKGRALGAFHHDPHRLDDPLVAGGVTTWDAALDDLGANLAALIAEHGPGCVGAYLGTGLAYDVNGWMAADRLFALLRTRQRYTPSTIDNAPALRAAELVSGTPHLNPVWDPERSRLLVIFGCNPVVSHGYGTTLADPVVRLRDFRSGGGEIWVVDPRRSETAALADRHLAPRPGTDHQVLAWLVRELLEEGADRAELEAHAHPADVARLRAAVAPFTLARVAAATGLDATALTDLLAAVRRAGRIAVMAGTGITMSRGGVVTEWLRWALLVVTGSLDREGGMRCNPGYLFPAEGHRFPAPPDPADPGNGERGDGPASRPDLPRWLGQLPCAGMADEIAAGNLRALVIVGGNPLTAFPDAARTRDALRSLDVLAVVDVVHHELTAMATHVLPAAGQLERADLPMLEQYAFGNGIQFTPAVVAPGARRRPTWWVMAQLGRRLDLDVLGGGLDPDAADDVTLLRRLAATSRGGADAIVAAGSRGIVMPSVYGWVHDALADGCWRIAPEPLVEELATLDADDAPALALVPHREMRAMNSARYTADAAARTRPPRLAVHPDDATVAAVHDGDAVRVATRFGALDAVVHVDANIRPGAVTLTHGWITPNVAELTSATEDLDPQTGMVRQSGLSVTLTPL